MGSQAVLLSLTYFRNFLLVVLELFSASDSPPNFSFIPAALAFEAPWPSDLVLGGRGMQCGMICIYIYINTTLAIAYNSIRQDKKRAMTGAQ